MVEKPPNKVHEYMLPYFPGCENLTTKFNLSYGAMERLKEKLSEFLRQGYTAEEALDQLLEEIKDFLPEAQQFLLEELLKQFPREFRQQLRDLLEKLRQDKGRINRELEETRTKEFDDLLQRILNRKDMKSTRSVEDAGTKQDEPIKLPIHVQRDFPQLLDHLESVVKSLQSKGQPFDDLLNDFAQLKEAMEAPPEIKNGEQPLTDEASALMKKIQQKLREKMIENLRDTGLFKLDKGKLTFGEELVEILSDRILEETLKEIKREEEGIRADRPGEQIGEISQVGVLIKESEMGNLLPIETLITALQRHPREITIKPEEDPFIVWKYDKETVFDTVIAVDMSGSMNRNFKHRAAKETALALERAVRRLNPKNRCVIIVFQSTVRIATPNEVWASRPTGYTNTPEALRLASDTVKKWNSKAGYILFVTDGYPELSGQPHAKVLKEAVDEARKLKYLPNSIFRMVLIENQKRFIDAGKAIVKAASGKLIVTDPNKLKDNVLTDFLQGFREIIAL